MTIRPIFMSAALVITGTSVLAAQSTATYDPSQVPEIKGIIAQYSLTPVGDVDGVILRDGTQVHLPPHLGTQLVAAVKPGDAVVIRGLKAQALPLVQAISIKSDSSGSTVVDNGPPTQPPPPMAAVPQWMALQGTIREPLYGPLGDVNGALLDDGAQVHFPPDLGLRWGQTLQAGAPFAAQGYGVAGPYGRSLDARRVGPSTTRLVEVGPSGPPPPGAAAPPPPPPPGAPAP